MSGAGPVDGDPEYINSTRAEKSGFIGPLHAIHAIAKKIDLRKGKLTMHVDNTSSFQNGDPPRPGEGALRHHCGDYNLKRLKQQYTEELAQRNITIEFRHVKAHQDEAWNRAKNKDGNAKPLTQAALLNIDCDARAEQCYEEPFDQSNKRILPHTTIQAYFESNGVINTGKLFEQILRDRHGPILKEYIKKKHAWTEDQFQRVDWPSAQTTFKKNTFNQRVRISKAVNHWLPTMERLHRIEPDRYPSPLCNICKKAAETQDHIFQCAHHASRHQQIIALKRIEKDGKKYGFNTFLIRTFTKDLHTWMHHKPIPEISAKHHPVHKLVREAYTEQTLLGWRHAMRGRISTKWLQAQHLHAQMRGSDRPAQGHILICVIWAAMDHLWKERNRMEHGTTDEERALHAEARMNLRIKVAYSKKYKVSQTARTQLFSIPRTRRIQYNLKTNERWLDLVSAAVSNRQRQNDKLHESLSKITSYYVPKQYKKWKTRNSTQARPYQRPLYTQTTIRSYYKLPGSAKTTKSVEIQNPEEHSQPRIEHQKTTTARITTYFKLKPD